MAAEKGHTRTSRLMKIAAIDEGFALQVDTRAAYELQRLEDIRQKRRLRELALVMLKAPTPGSDMSDLFEDDNSVDLADMFVESVPVGVPPEVAAAMETGKPAARIDPNAVAPPERPRVQAVRKNRTAAGDVRNYMSG